MTTNASLTKPHKGRTYVRVLGDGTRLEARVSPCVFIYPRYPLQITVTLHRQPGESLGDVIVADRTLTAETYTDADAERLLAGIRTAPCPRCSAPASDPASVQTNRGGLCEACFLADLRTELAADQEAEEREIAARDERMKRNGMVVRVTAWVHPFFGEDYQVDWYLPAAPTTADIEFRLRREGSTVLDDFQIVTL